MGPWQTNSEIEDYLYSVARKNNIDIEYLTSNDWTPDVAVPFDRLVIMNPLFKTKASFVYRLAHELAHIIFGDPTSHNVYAFSLLVERTEELSAHKNAVKLLARYDDGFANYADAIAWFGIPAFMEETVMEYVAN